MQISGQGQTSYAAMRQLTTHQPGLASRLTNLMRSNHSSNVSTTVTSTNPTLLANQQHQLTSELTQLQSQNGNQQQIEKIQQAIQTIKNKIQEQQQLAEETKVTTQSSHTNASHQVIPSTNTFTKGIDIKV